MPCHVLLLLLTVSMYTTLHTTAMACLVAIADFTYVHNLVHYTHAIPYVVAIVDCAYVGCFNSRVHVSMVTRKSINRRHIQELVLKNYYIARY